MCLLSKRIIFQCPNYLSLNVVCDLKRPLDLYKLELFKWTLIIDKRKVGTVSTITFKAVEESTTTDEESKPVVLL